MADPTRMSTRPTSDAQEDALSALNLFKRDLAETVKTVVQAVPGGISKWEWVSIGWAGAALGKDFVMAVTDLSPDAQRAMLWVLEHSTFALPEAGRGA